jgi:hypothetical protein
MTECANVLYLKGGTVSRHFKVFFGLNSLLNTFLCDDAYNFDLDQFILYLVLQSIFYLLQAFLNFRRFP